MTMRNYQGFTLIELAILIIIIGILVVMAVPKYIDITSDARSANVNSVAGALSSTNAANYARRKQNPAAGSAVANCTAIGSILTGGLPSGFTITPASVAVDTMVTCTVTGPGSVTAIFTATGIT